MKKKILLAISLVLVFFMCLYFINLNNSLAIYRDTLNTKVYLSVLNSDDALTVRFDSRGGSSIKPYKRELNEEIGALPTPTKDGENFIGWYTDPDDGTKVNPYDIVTDNVTYYAHWAKIVCKKASADTLHQETCATGGGCTKLTGEITYQVGDKITYGTPAGEGEPIKGNAYDCDVNNNGIFDPSTERFYYIRAYEDNDEKNAVLVHYTSFDVDGQMDSSKTRGNYVYDEGKAYLPDSTIWSNPALISFDTKVSRYINHTDIEEACGKPIVYDNTSYLGSCQYFMETSRFQSSALGRAGIWVSKIDGSDTLYRIQAESAAIQSPSSTTSANTVRPVIEIPFNTIDGFKERASFNITFMPLGGSHVPTEARYDGQELGELPTPTRSGYTFGGWYIDLEDESTKVTAETVVTSNITLYAKWIEITDKLEYVFLMPGTCVFNGTSGNISSNTNDCISTINPTNTEINYTTLSKKYIDTGVALYTEENKGKDYEIGFTIDSYVSSDNIKQATLMNTKYESSSDKYPGIVFRRKDQLIDIFDISSRKTSEANENISPTYTAGQQIKIYRTFNPDTNTQEIYYSINNEEKIFINDLSSFNPTFNLNVWFGAAPTNAAATSAQRQFKGTLSNLYIKLERETGEKVKVTFNAHEGTAEFAEKEVFKGQAVGTLPTATRSGYKFDGWYTGENDGTKVTTSTIVYNDTTYHARYIEKVLVTFNAQGGTISSQSNTMQIAIGDKIGSNNLPTASKDNQYFEGWYTEETGGTKITGNETITGQTTYYAHYKNIYYVTFDPNGGTLDLTPNPIPVVEGDTVGVNSLPVPVKGTSEFSGWYDEDGDIIIGSEIITGDITYYARWDAVPATSTKIKILNTMNTSIADDDPDGNLRFIGVNPNNYVWFNDQRWRIIGVFDGKLKIVEESIGSYAWDASNADVNKHQGVNQWGPSEGYDGADLMKLLNPGYEDNVDLKCLDTLTESECTSTNTAEFEEAAINNSLWWNAQSGYCYKHMYLYAESCNFTDTGLKSDTARNMIDNATWYLGTKEMTNTISDTLTARKAYEYERSNYTGRQCSSNVYYCSDTVERTTTWQGKVGLLYASDYIYATGGGNTYNREQCLNLHAGYTATSTAHWGSDYADCKNNDWLYSTKNGSTDTWLITPFQSQISSQSSASVYILTYNGRISSKYATSQNIIRPVVYLKPSITFTNEGDGSYNNPFVLRDMGNLSYTVTFNAQGGELDVLSNTMNIGYGDVVGKNNLPTASKDGSYFVGWYTKPTGGKRIKGNEQIIENTTYYAQYKTARYITFEGNGGVVDITPNPVQIGDGMVFTNLPVATRTGHTFAGWFNENNEQITGNEIITSNVTYYAHWETYPIAEATIRSQNTLGTTIADDDPDGNLRFIGANPNNYVMFNDQKWRIIGVFDNRLKIKSPSIGEYSWDTTNSSVNWGHGINQWGPSESYEGADIMRLLNPGYENYNQYNRSLWWNANSGYCYHMGSNSYTSCNFTNTGLKTEATRNMIDTVTWYLGSPKQNNNLISYLTASEAYEAERGYLSGKQTCSSSDSYCSDTVIRTTRWEGKVGLVYLSDVLYAANGGNAYTRNQCLAFHKNEDNHALEEPAECQTNNWLLNLDEWTMIPTSTSSNASYVYAIGNNSYFMKEANNAYSVSPVVYLKPSITITDEGDGSEENPFTLKDLSTAEFTLKFNPQDGEMDNSETEMNIYYGQKIGQENLPIATKDDLYFAGWYTTPTGGTRLTGNEPITNDGTYYAHYLPAHYVTYDANGGVVDIAPNPVQVGANVAIGPDNLPIATRAGYEFAGWYTETGEPVTGLEIITEDTTYIAHWNTVDIPEVTIRSLNTLGTSIADDDPDGNLRFIGKNPNNYVWFNNQRWRIIGIFDERLKLVSDSIGIYSWDSSPSGINRGDGINQWGPVGSYIGSDIMKLLNPGYEDNIDKDYTSTNSYSNIKINNSLWWNAQSGKCYNQSGDKTTSCNFTGTGLRSEEVRNMIDTVTWNVGSHDGNNIDDEIYIASNLYNNERSRKKGRICTQSTSSSCSDSYDRTTTWEGKVGLIYPSDFVYSTSGGNTYDRNYCLTISAYSWSNYDTTYEDCYENSWLYEEDSSKWTMTPFPDKNNANGVYYVGNNVYYDEAGTRRNILPTVYLRKNITLTSEGDGSYTNPFVLKDMNNINFTITFNANGGEVTTPNTFTKTYGQIIGSDNLPTASNENLYFAGWYTSPTGGTKITGNEKIIGDMTYYAHYLSAHYITYDGNGGVVDIAPNPVRVGADIAIGPDNLPIATKLGYKFIGWYTEAGEPVTGLEIITEDTTYIAHWGTLETPTTRIKALNTLGETIADDDPDGNLRFIGANPNNYVLFDGQKWRIIGIFDKRLKLIRASSIGTYAWDSSTNSINSGSGINQWGPSGTYTGADIMKLLNPGYDENTDDVCTASNCNTGTHKQSLVNNSLWWNAQSGYCYKSSYNYIEECDFIDTGLQTTEAKNMIDNSTWYLGSNPTTSSTEYIAENTYNFERGNAIGKNCSSGSSCNDNVERTTTWQGKVGLIYASDYIYATSGGSTYDRNYCLTKSASDWYSYQECQTNNWLNTAKWTMIPKRINSSSGGNITKISSSGYVSYSSASSREEIYPTVYLNSGIIFDSEGTGTINDPFILYDIGNPSYTVTFNANGGEVTTPNTFTKGYGEIIGSSNIPTASNGDLNFAGWYTTPSTGGTRITGNEQIISDVTYYARYKDIYHVTFDPDGGTLDLTPNPIPVLDGDTIGTTNMPIPTKPHMRFTGWYNSNNELMTGLEPITSDAVYHAVYVPKEKYTVTFNAGDGEASFDSKEIECDDFIGELPTATHPDIHYELEGWYLDVNDASTKADPSTTVITDDVTYNAKWVTTTKVAIIGTERYDTLQAAVNAVSTNGTKTTITLTKNTSENVSVIGGRNVYIDLNTHTVSNTSSSTQVFTVQSSDASKPTTLELVNGTATSNQGSGMINVNGNGILKVGNKATLAATGTRQAIYIDGGTVYINDGATITGASTQRAVVHNKTSGKLYIIGGTITSTGLYAIYNENGTVEIGTKDGNIDTTKPTISGITYGIAANSSVKFYDGIIQGKTAPIGTTSNTGNTPTVSTDANESKISEMEDNSEKIKDTSDGYTRLYLQSTNTQYKITLDLRGGSVGNNIDTFIMVDQGDKVGSLPTPTKGIYTFDGWYDQDTDLEVDDNTIPTKSTTYYANWTYTPNSNVVEFDPTPDVQKVYYQNIDTWKLSSTNFPSWSDNNKSPNWSLDATENTVMKNNFDYYNCQCADNQCTSSGTVNCDKPKGYNTGTGAQVNVYTYNTSTNEKDTLVAYAKGDNGVIYNLITNKVYYWELASDSSVHGLVKFTGNRRLIDAGDVLNVRDLGGLPVDSNNDGTIDGHLKYGRLIRGIKLNSNSSITELNNLGITKELDLREANSDAYRLSNYERIEAQNYYVNPNTSDTNEATYYAMTRAAVKQAMLDITNQNNPQNIYFHCRIGTDRTGTVAYVLEGLLGVPEEDRIRDFELSFFYGLVRVHRYHNEKPGSNIGTGKERFVYMHNFMPTNTDIYNWYMAGTTEEERQNDINLINAFRQAMIE